jgi:hypothetical protein
VFFPKTSSLTAGGRAKRPPAMGEACPFSS